MTTRTLSDSGKPHSTGSSNLLLRPFVIILGLIFSIIRFVKTLVVSLLILGIIALAIPLMTLAVKPELTPEFQKAATKIVAQLTGLDVSDVKVRKNEILLHLSEDYPVFTEMIFGQTSVEEIKSSVNAFDEKASVLTKEISELSEVIADPALSASEKKLLATLIITESKIYGIDPLFTTAIINTNNSLQKDLESEETRIGLLQLTPEKAKHIGKLFKIDWPGEQALADPIYNLQFGLSYLRLLDKVYKGDHGSMLLAFRWQKVSKDNSTEVQEKIPEEINTYIDQVLTNYLNLQDESAKAEEELLSNIE